jgi:hypothetical protein
MTGSRNSRVVYRLYGEDEFLYGAGAESFESVQAELVDGGDLRVRDDRTPEPRAAAQRLRRLAGTAMLLGAVGFVGGAILRTGPRPSRAVADRQSNTPAARRYVTATPRAVAARPARLGSGTGVWSGSSGYARQVAPARRLFARTGPAGARRRGQRERDGGTDQPRALDQRPGANGDSSAATPVVARSADAEPAAAEATAAKSAAVGSPTVGSPIGEPNGAASAVAARPVTAGAASSPRQMEFGFER